MQPEHSGPTILYAGGDRTERFEAETGLPAGVLLCPTSSNRRVPEGRVWAVDNGAFAGFDAEAFRALLRDLRPHRETCAFVAAPDVVGSARRTLEAFTYWRREIKPFRVALVAQDGLESLPIPWHELDAVFIGGSDAWKMSDHATHVIRCAQVLGKHVHVGRVNTPERFRHFEKLGVDTMDGTGLAIDSRKRTAIRDRHSPAPLFATAAPQAA